MVSLITQLLDALNEGRAVCYTALVETRGSTPQKAGARMLVFPNGSQVGTLGGGCVEAEVKRHALALLDQGRAEVLPFTLDHDYGWDDGLICGGRMLMLVDPCRPAGDIDFYIRYASLLQAGRGCTEVVAIDDGPAGLRSGAQLLFDATGSFVAARHCDSTPTEEAIAFALQSLRPLADRPRAYCAQGLAYLPNLPRCRLLIVGGGHVGQKVAELAAEVDFDVWVFDDRETYCNAERFPRAQRCVCASFEESLPSLETSLDDLCIIVTRGHQHDEQALNHLVQKPSRYLGMIGSRRKIRMIFDDLQRQGVPADALERVHAPLGIDIGSQTVPEIAVSIVAELIAVRNGAPARRPPR